MKRLRNFFRRSGPRHQHQPLQSVPSPNERWLSEPELSLCRGASLDSQLLTEASGVSDASSSVEASCSGLSLALAGSLGRTAPADSPSDFKARLIGLEQKFQDRQLPIVLGPRPPSRPRPEQSPSGCVSNTSAVATSTSDDEGLPRSPPTAIGGASRAGGSRSASTRSLLSYGSSIADEAASDAAAYTDAASQPLDHSAAHHRMAVRRRRPSVRPSSSTTDAVVLTISSASTISSIAASPTAAASVTPLLPQLLDFIREETAVQTAKALLPIVEPLSTAAPGSTIRPTPVVTVKRRPVDTSIVTAVPTTPEFLARRRLRPVTTVNAPQPDAEMTMASTEASDAKVVPQQRPLRLSSVVKSSNPVATDSNRNSRVLEIVRRMET